MASAISWRRGDFVKLGRAVSNFNKKIRELQKEEKKLYLPEEVDYSTLKSEIATRSELNRMINSLKRFQREGAEELYVTESGVSLTKWERRELGIESRTVQRRLNKELQALNEPTESGFSRAQMGSQRVQEIQSQIKNLRKIETLKGADFKRLRERIVSMGKSDYTYKRALQFRENYIKLMKEKYKNFENYDKFIAKLESITNPIEFFNFVSVNELTQDLTYQSDEMYSQESFNAFISQFGVEISQSDIQSQFYSEQLKEERAIKKASQALKSR